MSEKRTDREVARLLLDRHQAAEVLGVAPRTFQALANEPWMPRPVQLGPRLLRWALSELQEAVAHMPRLHEKQEPVRERIERLKARSGG